MLSVVFISLSSIRMALRPLLVSQHLSGLVETFFHDTCFQVLARQAAKEHTCLPVCNDASSPQNRTIHSLLAPSVGADQGALGVSFVMQKAMESELLQILLSLMWMMRFSHQWTTGSVDNCLGPVISPA